MNDSGFVAVKPIAMNNVLPIPQSGFWVFGYGSLMWDPGFLFIRSQKAQLFGYHRRLCLWSTRYRGTHTQPGLVLGLDRGGSCVGMAYLVDEKHRSQTAEYLYDREMISDAYQPIIKKLYLDDRSVADALTFVSKPWHSQYAPQLTIDETVAIVKNACGQKGPNSEYILKTVDHLNQYGIHHTTLHCISRTLELQL